MFSFIKKKLGLSQAETLAPEAPLPATTPPVAPPPATALSPTPTPPAPAPVPAPVTPP